MSHTRHASGCDVESPECDVLLDFLKMIYYYYLTALAVLASSLILMRMLIVLIVFKMCVW